MRATTFSKPCSASMKAVSLTMMDDTQSRLLRKMKKSQRRDIFTNESAMLTCARVGDKSCASC